MKHELFTRMALKADLPKHGLRSGDLATVVEFHPGRPGQEPGYSLEVFNAVGETVALVTVRESQIEPLTANELLHVRALGGHNPSEHLCHIMDPEISQGGRRALGLRMDRSSGAGRAGARRVAHARLRL